MKNKLNVIKSKGKLILLPILVLGVLLSVALFNATQNNGSPLVYAEDGNYLEGSGTVRSNAVSLSGEAAGTIAELFVAEGSAVKKGDAIAAIRNTTLQNQNDQALIGVELARKNLEVLETNLTHLTSQTEAAVAQAESGQAVASSEYARLKAGVSEAELTQAKEAARQARINRDYLKTLVDDAKERLDEDQISQAKFDEIEKNYEISRAQSNAAAAQLKVLEGQPSDSALKVAGSKVNQAESGIDLAESSAQTQIAQLQGQIEVARIQLRQQEAALTMAAGELDKLTLRSPLDGTIDTLLIDAGEFAAMGKTLVEISDPADLTVSAYVSEANIGHVSVGQAVKVYADSNPEAVFTGEVIRVSDRAEFTPKNIQTKEERMNTVFEVSVRVLDGAAVIKAGMPVDLRFVLE